MNEKTIIDELIDIFRIFDRDDDGYMGKSELRDLMKWTQQPSEDMEAFLDKLLDESDTKG
jgi:Ca2+-binding EF-hand superfamily protein